MDYHHLLKSETELKQEEALRKDELAKLEVEKFARKQWLSLNPSKTFIGQLESLCLQLNASLLEGAINGEISNEQFRLQAVEVQTLRKTLNLLNYGKYNDTGDNVSSVK